MKSRTISACAIAIFLTAGAIAFADPKSDIDAAAQKLADAPDYSWTQTIEGGMGASEKGKIQSDGLTYLAITLRNNTVEIYFQGDKGAVQTKDGWKTLGVMDENAGGGPNPVLMATRLAKNLKTPVERAQELADKATDLTKNDESYSGTLSETDATALLPHMGRRGGGDAPKFTGVTGDVKFWISDGMLTKFQYHVAGSMNMNGTNRDINRTATVQITDIGRTMIDVPAQAKAKWEAPASTEPAAQ